MKAARAIASIPTLDPEERARLRTNAERVASNGSEKDRREAQAVLEALVAQEQAERANHAAHIAAMGERQRVVEALRRRPLTDTEHKVVQALLDHPGSTSDELSRACGWRARIWHEKFGRLCRIREADLWPARPAETRDANFYSGILADLDARNRWSIKPAVAEALADLGIRPAKR